jgi:hypothetical protein
MSQQLKSMNLSGLFGRLYTYGETVHVFVERKIAGVSCQAKNGNQITIQSQRG